MERARQKAVPVLPPVHRSRHRGQEMFSAYSLDMVLHMWAQRYTEEVG